MFACCDRPGLFGRMLCRNLNQHNIKAMDEGALAHIQLAQISKSGSFYFNSCAFRMQTSIASACRECANGRSALHEHRFSFELRHVLCITCLLRQTRKLCIYSYLQYTATNGRGRRAVSCPPLFGRVCACVQLSE